MESYQELSNSQTLSSASGEGGKPTDNDLSIDTGRLVFARGFGCHVVKTRRGALRLVVVVCVLVAVIIGISVGTKKVISLEEHLPEYFWYETAVGYQIFPRSFQDSDGDGIGDLKGIINRLSYLEWIGIDAIWLSALNPSPFTDLGLDITDFTAVDPLIGDLVDFQALIQAAHSKGIKVVIEFVPNQSSEDHFWFQQSRRSKNNAYSDYYIWADGVRDGEPPNDWKDVSGNPSWEYVQERQQWYHHSFLKSEPSLNFDSPHIEIAITKALIFWMDQGVDGVYFRHVNHILGNEDVSEDQNEFVHTDLPLVTSNSTRVKSLVKKWRKVLKDSNQNGREGTKLLVVDTMDMEVLNTNIKFTISMYGTDDEPLADYPFNYALFDIHKHSVSGHTIRYLVESWLEDYRPNSAPTNWALGSTQISRITTRYTPRLSAMVSLMIMVLPGSPLIYYGDEIGMTDVWNNATQANVPYAPMQWNGDKNAGFTEANVDPWTAIDNTSAMNNVESKENHVLVDVSETSCFLYQHWMWSDDDLLFTTCDIQQSDENEGSLLHLIRHAIKLRRYEPSLLSPRDSVHLYGMHSNKDLLVFVRHHEKRTEHINILFVENFGNDILTEDIPFLVTSTKLPDIGILYGSNTHRVLYEELDLRNLRLEPGEAIAVEYQSSHY